MEIHVYRPVLMQHFSGGKSVESYHAYTQEPWFVCKFLVESKKLLVYSCYYFLLDHHKICGCMMVWCCCRPFSMNNLPYKIWYQGSKPLLHSWYCFLNSATLNDKVVCPSVHPLKVSRWLLWMNRWMSSAIKFK